MASSPGLKSILSELIPQLTHSTRHKVCLFVRMMACLLHFLSELILVLQHYVWVTALVLRANAARSALWAVVWSTRVRLSSRR